MAGPAAMQEHFFLINIMIPNVNTDVWQGVKSKF
jgi:hypothetical protein